MDDSPILIFLGGKRYSEDADTSVADVEADTDAAEVADAVASTTTFSTRSIVTVGFSNLRCVARSPVPPNRLLN